MKEWYNHKYKRESNKIELNYFLHKKEFSVITTRRGNQLEPFENCYPKDLMFMSHCLTKYEAYYNNN
jgi:hypothetical protein